ncbi:MAG TPA: dTDP-4-dehydrorhamnose reductase [Flavihumibacter sp.]|nr:dTDP-4-dehydrorhamnose reductase [Flavihumibacter sp.]HQD10037.1 dTDP-4-dehydrorhamnose reductase [Flavihumibacter sp.]
MPSVLVTGSRGQLGSELQVLAPLYPTLQFHFMDSSSLNITDALAVEAWFEENKPDYCINCAAYTAVDKAETETEKAFAANASAVGYLATASAKQGTRFIHISTDYVFDGTATQPIKEDQPVKPLGVYGSTKQRGEELALTLAPGSIVIRTSWVYSSFGNNFVKTMLRLMADRPTLNVVNDQMGTPTYAADLAKAILDIVLFLESEKDESKYGGIYHYSNEGAISWFDFAKAIATMSGSKCEVNPIPSSAYPTPAKRPAYSVFDKTKIKNTFHLTGFAWQDSLQTCLLQIQQLLAK